MRSLMRRIFVDRCWQAGLAIGLLFSAGSVIHAQRFTFPSELESTMKSLDGTKSEGMFRHAYNDGSDVLSLLPQASNVHAGILPIYGFTSYNSSYPQGDGDGALWQGRGVSGITRSGVEFGWDWGNIKIDPEWWFAQNQAYPYTSTAGQPYGDYWWGMDRLQAYGAGVYQTFGWGQSEARLNYGGFTLGFGTENLKIGPAEIQNIILSDNASGFPLLDVGTDGPIRTAFGAFDARLFWGQTQLSSWYDSNQNTNKFLWTGGTMSYSPPFLDTMSFGFTRAFHSPWSTMDTWKVLEFFDDNLLKLARFAVPLQLNGEDDVDQVLDLTWEWRIPQVGARTYIEWARNDSAADLLDLLMQPEHSDGYVMGLQQKIPIGNWGRLLLSLEIADLGNNIGTTIRGTGSWYRHSIIDNGGVDGGYTNLGQVMGSPMGPGSNSQELNVYLDRDNWFVGLGIQRMIYDADYFYTYAKQMGYYGYNLMLTGTLRFGITLTPHVELGSAFAFTNNWNMNFGSVAFAPNGHVELAIKVHG